MARGRPLVVGIGGTMQSPSSTERALEIGERLDVGNIYINQPQAILPQAPFGGHKSSGIGSESALDGLLAPLVSRLPGHVQAGEMTLREERRGLLLPTAIFARWSRS